MNTPVNYTQRYDGEGFEVPNNGLYLMACCDCNLVHDFVFCAESGEAIGVAARRNEVETAARRAAADTGPALAPEALVTQLVQQFFADTGRNTSSRKRRSEALRALIHSVYAQGARAGKP